MHNRSSFGIYAQSLRVWAIAPFSFLERIFQIERYIYAQSLDSWGDSAFSMLERELQIERHICSIARFIGRFAPFVRRFDGNRRRNDGQDDDEKRRKDGIIFLKKISGQIGDERTGISADKRFPIMRLRIGEISAQDGASGNTSRIHDRRRNERAFDDERSTIRIAIFDEVVNLYPHPRHERYRTGNRSE